MKTRILFIVLLFVSNAIYAQPANDSCANAETIALSTMSQTINFSINDAQINNEVGCEGTAPSNYADVWYEFTMPVNGNILINGQSSINRFAIYDACAGTEIKCFFNNNIVDGLIDGNTYHLRVFRTQTNASNPSFQSFTIQAFETPENENCSNALNINVETANPLTVNFEIAGAEINNEVGCEGTAAADYLDIWYEFTMPVNGSILINGQIAWNRFAIYDACGGAEIKCFTNTSNIVDGLVAGNLYKIRLHRTLANALNLSFLSFTIQAFEAAENDECANATNINVETANPFTVNFEIQGAEINNEVGCEGTAAADYLDIWYEFTMPVNGNININGQITWNRFAIYDACGGAEISCFQNTGIAEGLVGGNTYQLRVFRTLTNALNLSFQSFSIQAFEVVPNDDCINAENIQVDTNQQTIHFSITGAQINNEVGCEGTAPANYSDVWYEFEMPFSGDIFINGAIVWNQFALYNSCGGTELHCSSINAFLQGLDGGETYYLRVFRTEAQASNPGFQSFTIQAFENPTNCSTITIWDGDDWSNGLPNENTKAVINDDFEITTAMEWCELEIVNGRVTITETGHLTVNETDFSISIKVNGELEIEGVLSVHGSIENEGKLVFLSNDSSTGQIDTMSPGAVIIGDVEVHRYIPARRAFRFLASSLTSSSSINANWQEGVNNPDTSTFLNPNPGFGTHITGSVNGENGFDATISGNYSLFTLNNANQSWEAITNTDVNSITAGKAYRLMVRGDRSIDLNNNAAPPTNTILRTSGSLFVGSYSSIDFNENAGAFNFFGNPYQAAVDMNLALDASLNVNQAFYYVWDPQMGTRGAYVTIDLPLGTNSSSSPANQYLQPGQAAFVTTLNNGPSAITFEETFKAVDQPLTQVFNVSSIIDLRLYTSSAFAQGESASDALRIKFDEFGSNTVNEFDALKFFNLDENLARLNTENLLSIESRAFPEEEEEVLPLFINQYRTTHYVFEAHLTEMDEITVQLKDHFLNTVTTLQNNANTTYAFQVDTAIPESTASDRFELIVKSETLHSDIPELKDAIKLYPNPVNDQFTIQTKNMANERVDLKITCMSGRRVLSKKVEIDSNGQIKMDIPHLNPGVYFVELIHSKMGRYSAKLLKK